MKITIYDDKKTILLDSGSQISAISEDYYRKLNSKKEMSILPISNVLVSTAVSKKTTTIKYQVFLIIEIEGMKIHYPFLNIPGLTSSLIVGNDWTDRNETILNYKAHNIEVRGKILSDSTVMFGRSASEILLCSQKDGNIYVLRAKRCARVS